jgi:hypothetical protein
LSGSLFFNLDNPNHIRSPSFLLKPIFRANHDWTMRGGEESLKLELRRRHAKTPEEAAPYSAAAKGFVFPAPADKF